MSYPVLPLAILLALAPSASAEEPRLDGIEIAQLVLHQRIIIRIPRLSRMPAPAEPLPPPLRLAQKRGPRCMPMAQLTGATISGPDSIDLVMADGATRVRARLADDCRSLDYYSGFYLKPTEDGMVCAGRDAFRMRSGGSCAIAGFRRLVAKP